MDKLIVNMSRWVGVLITFVIARNSLAQVPIQTIPSAATGTPLDAMDILEFIVNFANYFFTAAGIALGIALVWSGFMYMSAGSDSGRVSTAKAIFKNGVIGAIIIFGIGVILATIRILVVAPGTFFI